MFTLMYENVFLSIEENKFSRQKHFQAGHIQFSSGKTNCSECQEVLKQKFYTKTHENVIKKFSAFMF